jgi:very-short-patch-repair endonuclease
MGRDVAAVVGPDGWITRTRLLERVSGRTIHLWLRSGRLVRLEAAVYATPAAAARWRVRLAAALEGREGVASHGTALALWELVAPQPGPLHITVEPGRSVRGSGGIVLHRAPGAYADRRRVDGLAVSPVERAVVDAWGWPGALNRADVRGAAIAAVRRRLCSPGDVTRELARNVRLPGRSELASLVALLEDGCQSELEIWGCVNVLRGPGMPPFVQQRRVTVAGQTFVLDAAYDDVLLAVEMDGAAWHGSRAQRERDIRRDALLATIGWQTLRFGFARMTSAAEACRRDIRATHAARLRLLTSNGVR